MSVILDDVVVFRVFGKQENKTRCKSKRGLLRVNKSNYVCIYIRAVQKTFFCQKHGRTPSNREVG